MFLRSYKRKKNGKLHKYFSVVENRRLSGDKTVLDEFWQERIDELRGDIAWSKIVKLLTVNCLVKPASEFYVHRQWFNKTAMDELLNTDYQIASKDRLYRCLDKIFVHKKDLCKHLKNKWEDMFGIEFDVLLYDITSTYFEGLCEQNPKAKFGYSRDKRSDCMQVVILIVNI